MTPPLPSWIREHRVPGYSNALALLPRETRLFGTEDLYGDWNGRALLLAKDFACSQLVRDRIRRGDPRPYRHSPQLRTNTVLCRQAEPLRVGPTATTCGLLYGSALACLLRDDGRMSGALPFREPAMAFGSRVLGFVVEHMPRLQAVVCLGEDAWQCAMRALDFDGDWRASRDSGMVVNAGQIKVIAAYHPAARVSRERAAAPWRVARAVISTAGGDVSEQASMTPVPREAAFRGSSTAGPQRSTNNTRGQMTRAVATRKCRAGHDPGGPVPLKPRRLSALETQRRLGPPLIDWWT